MVITSSPGKLILLGEHAVVFGEPAVALALDLRLRCFIEEGGEFTVNGLPLEDAGHSYISTVIRNHWDGLPLRIWTESNIPSGSGLGSSAAVSVATIAGILSLRGEFDQRTVAEAAFEVESQVQGRASPIDTSVCAHGQGIYIHREKGENCLWSLSRDTRRWFIHHLDVPKMDLVVGYTGIKAPTGPLVARVKRFADRSAFARDIVSEIGSLSVEGIKALSMGDKDMLGNLMSRNHKLLAILGVSSPELDKLIRASIPYSYGAKLTGAGGGGSMVALTDEVEKVCKAISKLGGTPIVAHTGAKGVQVEKSR